MECIWNGQRDPYTTSPYKWPACGDPSNRDWSIWRSALLNLFADNPTSRACRQLRLPLGNWLGADDKWEWWLSASEQRLYQLCDSTWKVYTPPTGYRSRRFPRYQYSHVATSGPTDGQRTKILQITGDRAFRATGCSQINDDEPTAYSTSLATRLQDTIPNRKWAAERLLVSDNGLAVASAIRDNAAIAVSDGSFKDQHGTAALVLCDPATASPDSTTRIIACHVTPGDPSDQSPYRSELSGIYGILCVVEELCDLYRITSGSITIGCDNEKCLWMSIDKPGSITPRSKSFDLLSAIRQKIRTIPITVHSHWVKGHQDNYALHSSRLDLWARLNIEMDSLAKLYWEDSVGRQSRQHRIHDETNYISVRGHKICSSLSSSLYTACEGHKLRCYWSERKNIPANHISSINWHACEGAAKLLGLGLRFWKTKHLTGIFGTGKWMHRWKFWTHSNCPRCGEPNEDAKHIVRCSALNPLWETAVAPLTEWFTKSLTPPDVSAIILEYIHAWRTSTAPRVRLEFCSPALISAVTAQSNIGWGPFLEGFVSIKWQNLMDQHFTSISSRRTGFRWCCGLIHRMWLLLRDLWDHRNSILHDTVPVAVQLATVQLNAAVSGQYHQGLDGLSPTQFRSYFSRPLIDLLAFTVAYKRNWLANLLAARDYLATHTTPVNRDQERRCLQAWLDLPRLRRPRLCRLRPDNPSRQPRPTSASSTSRPKRKRNASALPDNYSFIPFSR
jgi:hypothetical protein